MARRGPFTDEEARWLLNELGELIALHGRKRFLVAPILEPDDRYFPDRWEPTTKGARRLVKRLLSHAGLQDVEVSVREFERPSQGADWGAIRPEHTGGSRETIAWFAGWDDDGVARFGVAKDLLSDPELVVGAMCHEVAHAFREYHRLREDDQALEEKLTDLTTVYLGFGVLTANAAYRFTGRTEYRGAQAYSVHQHKQAGYLSLDAMSFLLAAQARARGLGFWERRHLVGLLAANQAGAFRRAFRSLAKRDDLEELLALPPARAPRRGGRRSPGVVRLVLARLGSIFARRRPCVRPGCKALVGADDAICGTCGAFLLPAGDA